MLVRPRSFSTLAEAGEGSPSLLHQCRTTITASIRWVRANVEAIIRHPRNTGHPLVEYCDVACAVLDAADTVRHWLQGTLWPPLRVSRERSSFLVPGAAAVLLAIAGGGVTVMDTFRRVILPQETVPQSAVDTASGQRRTFRQMPNGNVINLPFVDVDPESGEDVHSKIGFDQQNGLFFIVNNHKFVSAQLLPAQDENGRSIDRDPKTLITSVEKFGDDVVIKIIGGEGTISIPHSIFVEIARQLRAQKEPVPTMSVSVQYKMELYGILDLIAPKSAVPRESTAFIPMHVYYPPTPTTSRVRE